MCIRDRGGASQRGGGMMYSVHFLLHSLSSVAGRQVPRGNERVHKSSAECFRHRCNDVDLLRVEILTRLGFTSFVSSVVLEMRLILLSSDINFTLTCLS